MQNCSQYYKFLSIRQQLEKSKVPRNFFLETKSVTKRGLEVGKFTDGETQYS